MLKVGVLGAGHLGKIHLRLLQQSKKYELVGFYDPSTENTKKVEAEFGYKSFNSVDELIDAVEVVDIVTPTLSHFDCAKNAIEKGRHIFIEKPITKTEDMKGLKYRTVGISIDMFTAMGVSVNALPGGEIIPAMDRGLLDAAEFNNASSDRLLGFPDVAKVCMLQSFHQNAEQFEILFNGSVYNGMAPKLRSILDYAVEASSADMSWKAVDRYSKACSEPNISCFILQHR